MFSLGPVFCMLLAIDGVRSLRCLTNEAKANWDNSKNAVTALQTTIETNLTSGIKNLESIKDTILKEMKIAHENVQLFETTLQRKEWKKYNGHCYYFGLERIVWFDAERKCREIGGYLAQIEDKSENDGIMSIRPKTDLHYWIGLTDLIEGEYRWTVDQSLATYKTWWSGYGARGYGFNCVAFGSNGTWFDYPCKTLYPYICESNFCY